MRLTHEEKVEKFYSHGTDSRSHQENGFLSFGYWENDTADYCAAVKNLLSLVLEKEEPMNGGAILNVACGYGSETFAIYEKLHPDKIIAIDITEAHINCAKHIAEDKKLSGKIIFEKMDACLIPYESKSFNYVIGIEGPAHFNTREAFLRRGYKVLKPEGVLLLSDIIVDSIAAEKNWFCRRLSRLCSKHWYMPEHNWMTINELRYLLKEIGFKEIMIQSIGEHVYPGFAKFNTKWSSIVNAVKIRGLRLGIALTFISWLLGFTYRINLTDYVLVRAVK